MSRIMVRLSNDEMATLRRIAEREMRGVREQARFLLICGLRADRESQLSTLASAQTGEARESTRCGESHSIIGEHGDA